MTEVVFDIEIAEKNANSSGEAIFDEYEVSMMLQHTREQLNRHIQRALGDLVCSEHGEPAKVIISGTYSLETEQLDVSYNVDTCCKMFLIQAIAALNRR